MKEARRKYEQPVMTKVTFEDKELVAFATCKKAGNNLFGGCCDPNPGQPNAQLDQS